METQIKIKLCKVCGNSSEFHKFNGLKCMKCKSKLNNERLNEKQYYRNYYDSNKDILISGSIKYYADMARPTRSITSVQLCL
jgi:hypothetical protein